MGEEKWRCLNVGYSQLYLMQKQKFNQNVLRKNFYLNPEKPLILFTIHPIIRRR